MAGLVAAAVAWPAAQSITVTVDRDALHVQAAGLRLIDGEAAARLRDGRSLRFDLELAVLARADGPPLATTQAAVNVSYDLWEERFALVRLGSPPLSISHVTAAQAEAWALERLAVPRSALSRVDSATPFWIRLRYRAVDPERPAASGGLSTMTLRDLIERLGGRREATEFQGSLEGGPFRLSG